MKINWIVRLKNKNFWITIVPAIILFVQQIAALFGFSIDVSETSGKVLAIVDTAFVILAAIGVVNDPTTFGFSDSKRAMAYEAPKED